MADYSHKPLFEKLGLKPGMSVVVLHAPREYGTIVDPLPAGITVGTRLTRHAMFVHCFVRSRKEWLRESQRIAAILAESGTFWVSWPKKASGLQTELDDNSVRDIGLATGLVDVKVCSIDATWSGIKFVRRVRDRMGKN